MLAKKTHRMIKYKSTITYINIRYLFMIFAQRWHKNFSGINSKTRDTRIIVSLTSFPKRYIFLSLVIKSLLCQTLKPDKVVLYLDENLDNKVIPDNLQQFVKNGLEIQFRPYDLKPHKKYFFAIQEHPNDIVVTVDDDIIYSRTLIESLMRTYHNFPDCISATRAHKITFDNDGEIMPYIRWIHKCNEPDKPSMMFCATGVGGVLYPPGILPEDTFNVSSIMMLADKNDDIWLKYNEIRTGVKTVICPGEIYKKNLVIKGSQETGLKYNNLYSADNDLCIEKLKKHEIERSGRNIFTYANEQ